MLSLSRSFLVLSLEAHHNKHVSASCRDIFLGEEDILSRRPCKNLVSLLGVSALGIAPTVGTGGQVQRSGKTQQRDE